MTALFPKSIDRFQQRFRRLQCRYLARRPLAFELPGPIISFTFDDFPKNAWTVGGSILKDSGVTATYYASLGLMGQTAPTGRIFDRDDLFTLVADGHELGSHTYDHFHAWNTAARDFSGSTDKNQAEIEKLIPHLRFDSIAYPISCPNPGVKRAMASRFTCCRGGGQKFNHRLLDRNYLQAFFLEKSRDDFSAVASIVEQNRRHNGWLIFATHDIDPHPTPYGCTPEFFAATVECARRSGSHLLPVGAAWRKVIAADQSLRHPSRSFGGT